MYYLKVSDMFGGGRISIYDDFLSAMKDLNLYRSQGILNGSIWDSVGKSTIFYIYRM